MTRNPELQKTLSWTLLLVGIGVYVIESWAVRVQIDDAYISYRYARNLVEGHGLVFNVGEYVEGFTNLLWTLLIAAGLWLGVEAELVGHALGLTGGIATLVGMWFYARRDLALSRDWIAALPAAVVVSSGTFAWWSVSGMETAMFSAATVGALAAHARGRVGWATLLAVVATLTRPEGGLVAAVIFAFQLGSSWRQGWTTWRWPVAYAVFLLLLTAFRLAYYGSPLPNTFYAKVGGIPIERGWHYLDGFLRDGAQWLLLPAAIAAVGDRRMRPGAAFVVLSMLFVVVIGGDAFNHYRFLLPTLACLAVLGVRGAELAYRVNCYAGVVVSLTIPVAVGWHVFGANVPPALMAALGALGASWVLALALGRRWIVTAVGGMLAAAVVGAFIVDFERVNDVYHTSKRAERLARTARGARMLADATKQVVKRLLEREPHPRLIAAGGIGLLGYESRLPVLDIVGLVDSTVARSKSERADRVILMPGHQRSNAAYIFSRKPDYLLIPKRGYLPIPALVDIWAHPDLEAHYEWDPVVTGFRRKEAESAEAGS